MNMNYLLRVEGVNLDRYVFDTRDLSTIRGGGLLLLWAVTPIEAWIKNCLGHDRVVVVSQGASIGLFQFDAKDSSLASNVAAEIRILLRQHPRLRHATFVIDVIPAGAPEEFRTAAESLLAANRWRQLQSATLSVPPATKEASAGTPACAFDGVRPAGVNHVRNDAVSESVWQRREYGRNQKNAFYKAQTGLTGLPGFANDFDGIAKDMHPLEGKLAVFYADGNQFGGLQIQHCTNPSLQALWDHYIRNCRRHLLKTFLNEEVLKGGSRWLNAAGEVRFETLLWGGDELMFVMPASLGWAFATRFFREMGGLNLERAVLPQDHVLAGHRPTLPWEALTHAAALVFCQHHSPIDRVKRLAKDQMAEFAKGKDRERDSLVVVALESFDHLGGGYEEAMRARYNGAVPLEEMIFFGKEDRPLAVLLKEFAEHVAALRESNTFARGQLRALVNEMLSRGDGAAESAAFDGTPSRAGDDKSCLAPPRQFRKASQEEKRRLSNELRLMFPSPSSLWLQLEELWDYALPELP